MVKPLPPIPTHPGAVLREDVLPALNVTVTAAAKALGISRQQLHGILAEKKPISPAMAIRLGKYCGNGPDLWLAMQMRHDLALAMREMAKDVTKIPTATAA